MIAAAENSLYEYLCTCTLGQDTHEFTDESGQPDCMAARAFAEKIREQKPDKVCVEQRVNRVFLRITD
jgi:hypothetical protein